MAEALGLAFVKKEIQLQDNLVGTGFADAPPSGTSRVTFTGEIVSAIGFEEAKLCISYQVYVPDGWKFDDFNRYDTLGVAGDVDDINKRESVTQYSTATLVTKEFEEVNESAFSFPFDLQFIHELDEEASARPQILFQVNSLDSWNRNRIEGYGNLHFPSEEGSHEFLIQTWRPRSTLYNSIHSFFLGGSVKMLDLEEMVKSYKLNEKGERTMINRFNFETENSGEILVRLNCISHNYDRKKENRAR